MDEVQVSTRVIIEDLIEMIGHGVGA